MSSTPFTDRERKYLKVLIKQEAAKMLDEVIAECYHYNAERRKDGSDEVHYRTLELMQRYANHMHDDELAWIHLHEFEIGDA